MIDTEKALESFQAVLDRRNDLANEMAALDEQIALISGIGSTGSATKTRKTSKPKAKQTRKPKAKSAGGKQSAADVLLQFIIPTKDEPGIDRVTAYEKLGEHGVSSNAKEPTSIVSQAFVKLKGEEPSLIDTKGRGYYVLTKAGEKRRKEMVKAQEKADAAAAKADAQ